MSAGMDWKVLIAVLVSFALVLGLSAEAAAQTPLDAEAHEIAADLNCPVCKGESVAESTATLAQEMRSLIQKKLEQGESREEILQYFVDRYGEGILRDTPRSGFNLGLWLLPVAGLVLGVGMSLRTAHRRRARRSSGSSAKMSDVPGLSAKMSDVPGLSAEELARYERQLEEDLRS